MTLRPDAAVNAAARGAAAVVALVAVGVPAGIVWWAAGGAHGDASAQTSSFMPQPPVPVSQAPSPQPALRFAGRTGRSLLALRFDGSDRLVTNEFAYRNPSRSESVGSELVEITSGSLFRRDGRGWTGVPDAVRPDSRSTQATGSAIFRMRTKRRFGDVAVSFTLTNPRLVSTNGRPARPWDGVHVFIRYESPTSLYAVTVNRRDGSAVIKKKIPGGDVRGGTYYTLAGAAEHRHPRSSSERVTVAVRTEFDGAVRISLYSGTMLVLEARDDGVGGPPIAGVGRVGLRGDNAEFEFDDFVVAELQPREQ